MRMALLGVCLLLAGIFSVTQTEKEEYKVCE
jgi:hypothetical protein